MVRFEVDLDKPGIPITTLYESFGPGSYEIVEILVGADKEVFQLPLRHISVIPHFANAFKGDFAEAQSKSIHLLDEDPDAFRLLLCWLYRGLPSDQLEFHKGRIILWTRFFLMVDKWCLKKLSKSAAKHISNLVQDNFRGEAGNWAEIATCIKLAQGHPFRYVFVHTVQSHFSRFWPGILNALTLDTDFSSCRSLWTDILAAAVHNGQPWKCDIDLNKLEKDAHPADRILIPLLFEDEPFPDFSYLVKIVPKKEERREYIREYLNM